MKIKDLIPDEVLVGLLDGKVTVQSSETEIRTIRVYGQSKQPNKDVDDEFINVLNNGVVHSITKPLGLFAGNLALTVYCKSNSDGTAKTKRIRQIVSQCVELVNEKSSQGFFFELDPANVITPTTVNLTDGYATTVLNVAWHTTQ